MPAASKVATEGNHPTLMIDDAPRWFAALQEREGTGARALQFLALTAVRSQEVRGATWDEIDTDKGLWIIPAARMLSGLTTSCGEPMGRMARQTENPDLRRGRAGLLRRRSIPVPGATHPMLSG